MIINKEGEKHIRNLARCLNRANKPYEKLGNTCSAFKLFNIKGLSQAEKDSISNDIAQEVCQLLFELGVDYRDYPGGYENWETVTLYEFNLEKEKLDEIIELLQRGEKFEKMWKGLEKGHEAIKENEPEDRWLFKKEMVEIKQKYFPKKVIK